jgi:YVTN family beta-propeller protein
LIDGHPRRRGPGALEREAVARRQKWGRRAAKEPLGVSSEYICATQAILDLQCSVGILGAVEARVGGGIVDLGGRKPAALLALLALGNGDGVSTERLIDGLWGDDPPRTARKSLQVHVSRLRSVLGDGVVETVPQGYVLRLDRAAVDLLRFEDLVGRGRAELEADDAKRAASTLREALSIWRGPPLAGLEDEPFARVAMARLADLKVAARELRVDSDLALGRHAQVVGELEALIAEHPFRERLRGQLMLALYRSGRQADALAVYRETRAVLVAELGVEPGPELRHLEAAMLSHDPELDLAPKPPRRSSRRQRRLLTAGATAAIAVAAVVTGLVLAMRTNAKTSPPIVVANSVVKIDPRTNEIVQVTKVGRDPSEIVVGHDAVWVVNFRDRTISSIGRSGSVETIGGVAMADHLAIDGNSVWVSSAEKGSVSRIDARTGEVVESIGIPKVAEGLALGGGFLWITSPALTRLQGPETVARLDLRTGNVVSRIPVGRTPLFTTFGDGAVWVANYDDDTVSVIRPGSSKAETINVGDGPLGIATGFNSVWVICYFDNQLVRIDSRTGRIQARIQIGNAPLSVSTGAGAVWVTSREKDTVQRVNPHTNKVTATIPFPKHLSPQGISTGRGGVWVTVQRCAPVDC